MSGDIAPRTRPGAGRALAALALPAERIQALSLERVRAAAPAAPPPTPAGTVALRIAYAAADPGLLGDVHVDPAAVTALVGALASSRAVLCDTRMAAAGMAGALARCGSRAICVLDAVLDAAEGGAPIGGRPRAVAAPGQGGARREPARPGLDATRAAAAASTRSARGLVAHASELPGAAAAVIGTSPTALLALLDLLADGVAPPAAVVATCCGHVAAAEAKELMLSLGEALRVPVICVRGVRGGAAVAAAAVNACAELVGACGELPADGADG